MAYRRQPSGSRASSRAHWSKDPTSKARESISAGPSSPAFQIPSQRQVKAGQSKVSQLSPLESVSKASSRPSSPILPIRARPGVGKQQAARFSRLGSVSRASVDPSSAAARKRLSLYAPSSHADSIPNSTHDVLLFEETEEEIQAREDADSMNEIIMAIDMKDRGSVGCAYYVAREEKMYLMEDIKLAGLDIVDTLKTHAQPTVLLISTRADESLEDYLRRDAHGDGDTTSIFGSYVLHSVPSKEFGFESGKEKLISLGIGAEHGPQMQFTTPGDPHGEVGRQGSLMRLAGWVNLDSYLAIGCGGAVLSYLSRRKFNDYLPGDEMALMAFRIKSIEMFTLQSMMFVSMDTLASLQILQSESHPNAQMQGPTKSNSGAKESLSVYGLFHRLARTPQGKLKLRQIFLRPTMDLDIIQERQLTLSTLLRPGNSAFLDTIVRSLKSIKNIRTVVVHLQKGITNVSGRGRTIQKGVWLSLQQFIFHALKLSEAIRGLEGGDKIEIVRQVLSTLDPIKLKLVGQLITETVDFPRSAELHRTVVTQGVDSELDNAKRTYDGMDDLLTDVAADVMRRTPEWARQYIENCVFFPQLGFLTVVPIDAKTGKGLYEGEGVDDDIWQKTFQSESMGYYKNRQMKDMDRYFGDMYGVICDKEIEIIHDLAVHVLDHAALLSAASDICGELDSLVALALGAKRHNYVAPRVTTGNAIHISGGRHPLQELTVGSYVPNDTFICGGCGPDDDGLHETEDEASVLMMTGPNYSGKTVYLKQIALIVYMAHIGSFVPAESAIIGLTDKILTRIATRATVSKTQSAFMIDLQQVALAITMATRRSLIVIDEFGKGTSSSDGAGLACGLFEYLLNLRDERPKVLGTTHFHEIFESGFLRERPELAFGHMEVHIDSSSDMAENQIVYLYNFVKGKCMSSFGTMCAAMNGIDPAVVKRADQLIVLSARGEDLVAACSKLSEEEAMDLEEAEQICRQFLWLDLLKMQEDTHFDAASVKTMLQGVLRVTEELCWCPKLSAGACAWSRMPTAYNCYNIAIGHVRYMYCYHYTDVVFSMAYLNYEARSSESSSFLQRFSGR